MHKYVRYILFNNKMYEQSIGLPRGEKASNILANFYLYYYEHATAVTVSFKYICIYAERYDIIVFYLNNKNLLLLLVYYPANLNFNENCFISNVINFFNFKNIPNSSQLLGTDLYYKRKDFTFNVNIFTNLTT